MKTLFKDESIYQGVYQFWADEATEVRAMRSVDGHAVYEIFIRLHPFNDFIRHGHVRYKIPSNRKASIKILWNAWCKKATQYEDNEE